MEYSNTFSKPDIKEEQIQYMKNIWYNEVRKHNEEIEDINKYEITPESILRMVEIRDEIDDNVFCKRSVRIHSNIHLKYDVNKMVGIDIFPPNDEDIYKYYINIW